MFHVDLYEAPLAIKDKLPSSCGPEMQPEESAFVCGLIRKYRPKKILEVGVAAGGTTAIILNCLSLLDIDADLYSVDLSEKYYRDSSLKTGFLAESAKKILKNSRHATYYGKFLPECIENIGDGIDFVILDTVHSLPGELFDFLVSLDKLINGAVVVMHDVLLPYWYKNFRNSMATTTLFSCAVSEKKYMNFSNKSKDIHGFLSIGAFEVSEITRHNVQNVFLALSIPWFYIPDERQIKIYRDYYRAKYNGNLLELFDMAVILNERTKDDIFLSRRPKFSADDFFMLFDFMNYCRKQKNLYIYGHGIYGKALGKFLFESGIPVKGFVISDNQPDQDGCMPVSSLKPSDDYILLLGVAPKTQDVICAQYKNYNLQRIEQPILNLVSMVI